VFDEIFKTPRLESIFGHDNLNAIFIYVCSNVDKIKRQDQRARILYISKDNIEKEMERCSDIIRWQCAQSDLYNLVYDGVNVNLPYDDIYYMEKIEKLVYFHTKKGVFHKRTNMSDLEEEFSAYGFIRTHVSYLVNEKHIVAWFKDEVDLDTGKRVPLSRAQKRKILSRKKENMQTVPD
jgi:DNA-binding LytR/AlgR family response regulator